MPAEVVLDASVAVKCVLLEEGSDLAKAYVASAPRLIAPDLIFVEVANAIVKGVRRAGVDAPSGRLALADVEALVDQTFPTPALVGPAFDLATQFGLSAHDAVYLALARDRGARMITADVKLVRRVEGTSLAAVLAAL